MTAFLLDVYRSLTDPDRLIHLLSQVVTGWFGYALLAGIVFAETGLLGHRTGPAIFRRPDSLLFKQEYVTRTQHFYERHGGKTLIYAKFVPFVRTFAPFMAGVGRMGYWRFLSFNVWGGLGWVLSMTLAGYGLGGIPFIRRNFEKVVLGIVFVSVAPLLVQYLKSRFAKK
jgi:membrane-associated protein